MDDNILIDANTYLNAGASLLFLVGIIFLLGWAGRRFGLAREGNVSRQDTNRLFVVQSCPIDARRRLVLVRRDETEHLLMLGPNGDHIVEAGIPAPAEKTGETP